MNSCDPGAGAKIGGSRLTGAVNWPLARTYAALAAIESGAPQDEARCYGRALLEAFAPEQLAGHPSAAQERQIRKLAAACQHD